MRIFCISVSFRSTYICVIVLMLVASVLVVSFTPDFNLIYDGHNFHTFAC